MAGNIYQSICEDSKPNRWDFDRVNNTLDGSLKGSIAGSLAGLAAGGIVHHFDKESKESRNRMKIAKAALKVVKHSRKLDSAKNNPEAMANADIAENELKKAMRDEKKEYAKRRARRLAKYTNAGSLAGMGIGAIAGSRKPVESRSMRKHGREELRDRVFRQYLATSPNSSAPFNKHGKRFHVTAES